MLIMDLGAGNWDNGGPWFSMSRLNMTHLIGLSPVMHLYLGRLSTDFSKIARAASASLPSAPGAVLGSLKASDVSYTQQDSCEKVPQTSTVRCPVHAEGYRLTSVQIKLLHADRNLDNMMCYHEFSLMKHAFLLLPTCSHLNIPPEFCVQLCAGYLFQSFQRHRSHEA